MALSIKLEHRPILSKKGTFFEKKKKKEKHQKFHHPLFNPFLSVLHKNKALHNFRKSVQCLITGHIKGLD